MRYAISCEGLVIGHSAFETQGVPRGMLRGRFEPTMEYDRLRPLFRADTLWHVLADDRAGERLLARAERARRTLRFALHDEAGRRLNVAHVYVSERETPAEPSEIIAFVATEPAAAGRPVASARRTAMLRVEWCAADGSVTETLDAPGVDARLRELAHPDASCLRFVDPRDWTVFNRLQLPTLACELRGALAIAPAAVRPRVDSLLTFLDRPADVHHHHVCFAPATARPD